MASPDFFKMLMLEGNVLTICGQQCTLEFQPSADQSWQSWANGELNQAATYPSPYAYVHKGSLGTMGACIGHSISDIWKPPSMEKRKADLLKLNQYRGSLSKSLSQAKKHEKELSFMAGWLWYYFFTGKGIKAFRCEAGPKFNQ